MLPEQAVFLYPGGGRLDGMNFAISHADGDFNIGIGARGASYLAGPFGLLSLLPLPRC